MIKWDYANAAHLLRRAGFGATRGEILRAVQHGQKKTARSLLKFRPSNARPRKDDLYKAQVWWLKRMLNGPSQVQEKLTVFWHGHFATSISKVDDVRLMIEQNRLFRLLGAGKFRDLLTAVSKDAAMIVWLDSRYNTKRHPNENFAREVMELFTLGIVDEAGQPNYTQKDVTEAARAFTGYDYGDDGFFIEPSHHDEGDKTVLGLTGNLTGDDVVNHLAGSTQCARYLAKKIWSYYAYPNPETAAIDALAQAYLDNDSDITAVLYEMFLRDEFYSGRAKGERVSSPVEFVVGTLRAMGAKTNATRLPDRVATMGQDLFNPPNVAGWPGGLTWMTSVRQLERFDFAWSAAAARRSRDKELSTSTKPLLEGLKKHATPADVVDHVIEVLGPMTVPAATRATLVEYLGQNDDGGTEPFDVRDRDAVDKKVRGLAGLVLILPEAQLV
jgi:uncharacterized protein (DUF1800 family)